MIETMKKAAIASVTFWLVSIVVIILLAFTNFWEFRCSGSAIQGYPAGEIYPLVLICRPD